MDGGTSERIPGLNDFRSVRGLCMILALGLVASAADTARAQATSVPVGNFSFEIEGSPEPHPDWRPLPDPGDWVDGNASDYDILELDVEGSHFPHFLSPNPQHDNRPGPGGANVLNLSAAATAATAMTQDLGYSISAGDLVAVSYVLGDSEIQTAGNVEVSILVGGATNAAVTVVNDADNGDFKPFKSVFASTASGNLSIGFKNKSNGNWLDVVDVVVMPAATAAKGYIPIGNFSFETESTASGDAGWYHLPAIGSWEGADVNEYQLRDLSVDTTDFPSLDSGPDGVNVLNLANTGTITHDTGYTVSVGDEVTLGFSRGNSATQDPGNVTMSLLIDGIERSRRTLANTATNGGFTQVQSSFRSTSSGTLSVRFQNRSGVNWLDDVSVKLRARSIGAPAIQGSVHAALVRPADGAGTVFYSQSDNDPPPPTAGGFGGVSNSLGEVEENSFADVESGSQAYSVSWADGEAAGEIGSVLFSWPISLERTATVYGGATAAADLYIDFFDARLGSTAEGLASGGIGGTTYDGSDTGGNNGFIIFDVEFTIDASLVGLEVDGAFGIQVDVFSLTQGIDLALTNSTPPYVTGPSIVGSVAMTEEERLDQQGDAWTFTLGADEVAAAGGSIRETYTAHFGFDLAATGTGIGPVDPVVLTLNAFALAEGVVLPHGTLLIVR